MIAFREIDDADPALAFSPLVRGMEKTFAWIGQHGGIPLTPSKAFKRSCQTNATRSVQGQAS